METNEVSFEKGLTKYRVIVGEETAIARMRRNTLRTAAVNAKETDEDLHVLHVVIYPDCVAAVVDWCGMQRPTFEEFQMLPGKFVDDWAAVVWRLIPEWVPGYEAQATEEDEKKVLSSPVDSPES